MKSQVRQMQAVRYCKETMMVKKAFMPQATAALRSMVIWTKVKPTIPCISVRKTAPETALHSSLPW